MPCTSLQRIQRILNDGSKILNFKIPLMGTSNIVISILRNRHLKSLKQYRTAAAFQVSTLIGRP